MKNNIHSGVNREEIPTAGIIEKLLALLAAVKLIAKQMATPNAAKSPSAKIFSSLNDPNVINPMPISAPIIVKIILKEIFSYKNILLIIAAKTGDVLIINNALAIDVSSIATTNNKVPIECVAINITPLTPGDLIKDNVGFL